MQGTNQLSNISVETTDTIVSCESNKSLTTLIGTYVKTLKKNFTNGYTVYYISCKGFDDFKINGKILCKGYLPITTRGVPLKLIGYFQKDYNEQDFFNVIDTSLYSNKKEITLEYILNIKIKGIGPKTAEKILEITGPDIFSYIKQNDVIEEFSNKIPGFKRDKIEKFVSAINDTHFEKEIFEYIKEYGGSYLHSQNLFDKYHSEAIVQIKKNPYTVGKELDIPFIVCDAIARKEGITPYDKQRIHYLIISTLYNIASRGNTISTLSDIYNEIKFLINSSAFPETIIPCSVITCALHSSHFVKKEIGEKDKVFYALKELNDAEEVIAQNLNKIINSKETHQIDIPKEILYTENKFNIEYSENQKEAFKFLLSSGIKILTGGPGTGKSTVVNGLIDMYKRHNPSAKVVLCAPTGRAAQKMKEITQHEAFTIHRLLNIQPYKSENENIDYNDIEHLNADLIIIDEVSMVDTKLFAYITSAISPTAITILCGDTFQLPSVGPGNILQDLMSCKLFDTVMLDVIHRQKNGSDIVTLSQSIKNGDISSFTNASPKNYSSTGIKNIYNSPEVQIIEAKTSSIINKTIIKTLKKAFFKEGNKYFVDNILDLQILSSTKKNEAGIVSLNQSIKDAYHKITDNENSTFSIGDKVMMIENNYDIGYYNGDVGFIKDFDTTKNSVIVEIDNNDYEIPHTNIKDISLAYACTIHKSQGSEYQYVIISLPKEPISMLQRNLIYTAVTRAKKYVAIISEADALQIAVNKNSSIKRRTCLKNKILNKIF